MPAWVFAVAPRYWRSVAEKETADADHRRIHLDGLSV
jgi:hypothetical protein